jgi:hypothetical protein
LLNRPQIFARETGTAHTGAGAAEAPARASTRSRFAAPSHCGHAAHSWELYTRRAASCERLKLLRARLVTTATGNTATQKRNGARPGWTDSLIGFWPWVARFETCASRGAGVCLLLTSPHPAPAPTACQILLLVAGTTRLRGATARNGSSATARVSCVCHFRPTCTRRASHREFAGQSRVAGDRGMRAATTLLLWLFHALQQFASRGTAASSLI